jgi:hypothetical protein
VIRRALGCLYRRAALDTATRCVYPNCRKHGGGTAGLVATKAGPMCRDHIPPSQLAELERKAGR